MSILDNVRDWFTSDTSRNKNSALLAGFMFFAGWWILIDAMAKDNQHQITTGMVFIGIFGTISCFMVNTVRNSHVTDNPSESRARFAQIWLLIGFVIGFASVIAAVWVMIDDFINVPSKANWMGVALLMENILILVANLVYKFGRSEEHWNDS